VTPDLRDAERLQGFKADWTRPAEKVVRRSYRWKLVGNAVCVNVAAWLGSRIQRMSLAPSVHLDAREFDEKGAWPLAALGKKSEGRVAVNVSTWPCVVKIPHLAEFLKYEPEDLSLRAISGFMDRLRASSLRYPDKFLDDLRAHQILMTAQSKN